MNEKIYYDIQNLKQSIKNTDEYKAYIKANEELEKNEEAQILSYKKDVASMEYEDAIKHFGKNSKEALAKEKALSEIVYNLNHLKVVEEYNIAYKAVKKYYDKINQECFNIFGVKK